MREELVSGCRCGGCTCYRAPEIRCSHARFMTYIETVAPQEAVRMITNDILHGKRCSLDDTEKETK